MIQVVCRDVWALHLALLPSPPSAEPYLYALEHHGEQKNSSVLSSSPVRVQHDQEARDRDVDDRAESSGFESESLSSEEEEEIDPEMEKLLRENSAVASSDEEEGEDRAPVAVPVAEGKKRRRRQVHGDYDVPVANLAVLMVACWTLRIPVMYMDFKRYEPSALEIIRQPLT